MKLGWVVGALAASLFLACRSSNGDAGDDANSGIYVPLGDGGWPVLAPLTNCGDVYLLPIAVGGQAFNVSVDTGSGSLAIADKGCAACASAGVPTLFNAGPGASDLHQTAVEDFGDGTSDTGWSGEIFSDSVRLSGTKTAAPVRFIAVRDEQDAFSVCPTMDGLIGLGPSTGTIAGTDNVIGRLVAAGMPKSFAIRQGDSGGQLWLGGFDRTLGIADPMYVPLSQDKTAQYTIDVDDVMLGGKSLAAPGALKGPAALDTGTTDIDLPSDAYEALVAEVTAAPGYKTIFGNQSIFTNCLTITDDVAATIDATLPHLTLKLEGGMVLDLPPTSSYVVPLFYDGYDQGQHGMNEWCPGVEGSATLQGSLGLDIVLGRPVFRSNVVIFDLENQRAGFMAAASQ